MIAPRARGHKPALGPRHPASRPFRYLDLGVNYIDTSSIYGGPERWSERYVGRVMKRRRSEAFLASKTKERTRDGSMRMLEGPGTIGMRDAMCCARQALFFRFFDRA